MNDDWPRADKVPVRLRYAEWADLCRRATSDELLHALLQLYLEQGRQTEQSLERASVTPIPIYITCECRYFKPLWDLNVFFQAVGKPRTCFLPQVPLKIVLQICQLKREIGGVQATEAFWNSSLGQNGSLPYLMCNISN